MIRIVQLAAVIAVLVSAVIGIMLVLDIGSGPELRETLMKILTVVGIIAVASIAILLMTKRK